MKIELNGKNTHIPDNATIDVLLESMGYKDQRVAVEVNQQVIPRGEHISFILSSSDKVEIIHAVGGG